MTLKENRISKGYTQKEAAKILGVSIRTYKRLEKKSICRKSIIDQISECSKKGKYKNKLEKINVVIVGAGFVGLSTGFLLNELCNVQFVDINQDKVNKINNNVSPLNNQQFTDIFANKPNFSAFNSLEKVDDFDVLIIALPTNLKSENNSLDVTNIESVIMQVNSFKKKPTIIIRSTLPVGATRKFSSLYDGTIIFMPEFLREATAIEDAFKPSRLIFGVEKKNDKVLKLSRYFQQSTLHATKTFFMSFEEAEAVKLFSNTYLAMRVSFFNELDSYATCKNLNVDNLITGVSTDPRIGNYYNSPSFGYGGYCLPKDSLELKKEFYEENIGTLIPNINASNNERMNFIAQDILNVAKTKNENPSILIIEEKGTHKGNLKTVNEHIFDRLVKQGVNVEIISQPFEINKLENIDLIVTNSSFPNIENYLDKLYTKNHKLRKIN